MAKFKSEQLINRAVPFVLGTVQGDAEGIFEVFDDEFVKFLAESTNFERLDLPKAPAKDEQKSKPEAAKAVKED
jgi:hypothetical protein